MTDAPQNVIIYKRGGIKMTAELTFRTINNLDCCHDTNCEACHGIGYISPRDEAIKMTECECNEAKYAVIVLNRIQMMKNIKILCDKCNTVWGFKEASK